LLLFLTNKIENIERIEIMSERTAAYLSSKVDGSILGKSFNATGRRNSMNGTMMKTENGIRQSKS